MVVVMMIDGSDGSDGDDINYFEKIRNKKIYCSDCEQASRLVGYVRQSGLTSHHTTGTISRSDDVQHRTVTDLTVIVKEDARADPP